jgi:hypothetical protein
MNTNKRDHASGNSSKQSRTTKALHLAMTPGLKPVAVEPEIEIPAVETTNENIPTTQVLSVLLGPGTIALRPPLGDSFLVLGSKLHSKIKMSGPP